MRNQVMLWSVCLGLLLFLGLLAVLLPVIGPVADAALGVSVFGIVGVGLHEARVGLPAYHARIETQAQALKEAQEYQRWVNPMHQAALDAEHRRKMAERAMQLQEDVRAIPQYGGIRAPSLAGYVEVTPVYREHAQIAAPEQEQAQAAATAHIATFADLLEDGQFGNGSMIIGIKPDGDVRFGEWQELLVFGVWGGTHSGKTTTVAEKACEAVVNGASLIVCDPHAQKADSLARKLAPLVHCLYPGTLMAVSHSDILANITRTNSILEARVKGADCSRPVVLIVEEWNRLQRDEEVAKAITKVMTAIGQEGRGFNVYGILSGQTPTYESQVRKAMAAHIVHRMPESDSGKVLPGRVAKLTPELPVGCSYLLDVDGMLEKLWQPLLRVADVHTVAAMTRGSVPSSRVSSEPSPVPSLYRLPAVASAAYQEDGPARPGKPLIVDAEKVSLVRKMLAEIRTDGQARYTQTDILREVWGIQETSGRAYSEAASAYRRVLAHLMQEGA